MSLIKTALGGAILQTHFTSAVILAAGSGERFGNADGTKQNVSVAGIPAVVRAALPFEKCARIDEIVLVGREDEIPTLEGYVKDFSLTKVKAVVPGGATRDESSAAGVAAVSDKCKFVAIHDGARCLVTEKMIDDVLVAAYRYGAAACAERVVDTVKICDSRGMIQRTVDRDSVRLIKTPQVFKRSVYEVARTMTRKDGVAVTDDCMMAEHVGFAVKLVDCGRENIKLTTRDDLALSEYIISKREREAEE